MDNLNNISRSGLRIAHLNVGSLLAPGRLEMLKIQIQAGDFDVFGMSESWLNEAIPAGLVAMRGFSTTRLDRKWNDTGTSNGYKKGGGVICYIRDSLQFSDTNYAHLNNSSKDLELQWISLNLTNVRPIVILNAYRPPQGDYKRACKLIHQSLAKANLKSNAEIFLMGDFNINLKSKSSPETKELLFTTGVNGLTPMIKETTRCSHRAGQMRETCIDNIFTNSSLIAESKVLDLNISDHLAVFVLRKKARVFSQKVSFIGRSYKNFVKEDFQEALIDLNWDNFYASADPRECWDILEKAIRDKIDAVCPLRSFRVKEIREPWITDDLLEEIRDKDNYLRLAKNTGKEEDWTLARRERNRVGKLVRNARAEFVKEQQREFKSDPKKFWKTVSTIIPGKKQAHGLVSLNDQTTGEDIKEAEVANYVNEFFSSIGPKLASRIDEPWDFHGHVSGIECPEFNTDFEEVLQLCKEINISKSSGVKDIAAKVFKSAFMVLIPQLVYMFNLSFATGIFPEAWKQATVIPLFKGGDRTSVENYRPISLLPIAGKLIEKIAHNQMTLFLEDNAILSDKQNGFRKGFSTASAVADLTDDIFSSINDGEVTLAVFVDLRKAFDTVCHEILCKKLSNYGLRGKVLDWCTNYLEGRHQVTLANNIRSDVSRLTFGVPQGSVLGPLFFILYVNDIQQILDGVKVQLYADDTVIFASGRDLSTLERCMQTNLDRFQTWCDSNKLTLNPKKTKMVGFGTRHSAKRAKSCNLYMSGRPIQNVPSFKYLGFFLDATLNFKVHINDVIRKVIHKRILLSKMMPYLSKPVALSIYKMMILPYFDYCDIIYSKACKNDLDKLQRLQNKCLKTCMKLHRQCDTDHVHEQTKCAFLGPRRKAHLCNFMFSRQRKVNLLDTRDINTRQHDAPSFTVKFPNAESFKRSVQYNGSVTWNDLPVAIRKIDNLLVFKATQKRLMFGGEPK